MERRYTDLSDPGKNGSIDPNYYRSPDINQWQGRFDGAEPEHLRWHQGIRPLDLISAGPSNPGAFVLLGFSCDEGVRRNKGRAGAAEGPGAIRKALANLPYNWKEGAIRDAGDITCKDNDLEGAQEQLGLAVHRILEQGGQPILLGGGHEVTFGHFLGINRYLHAKRDTTLGAINFDAHFDNRAPGVEGPSSGTGFWQINEIAETTTKHVPYLAIGIQRSANTKALFLRADQCGTGYITAEELRQTPLHLAPSKLEHFIGAVDHIYLTIDLDVFASAFAPGVSAATPLGLFPDQTFFNCLNTILDSGKVISIDFTELNPSLDSDNRTAKLAATLIFHIVERLL